MPYKYAVEHIKLSESQDRRRKLTDDDRAEIIRLYGGDGYSQRELARKFGVSRRLITYTLYPERLEEHSRIYKEEKRHLRYYDKEKHRVYMKKHRRYKQTMITGRGVKEL